MNSTIKNLIFFTVIFLVSCTKPTDMLTVINSDGSCYREFSENADSSFLKGDISENHNPFPVDIDSTWKIAWKYNNSTLRTDFPLSKSVYDSISEVDNHADQKSMKKVLVFARRDFKSVDEMDSTFKFKKSNEWSKMIVKHKLDKKFSWFYTYYTYSETYPKMDTGFELPIENYMSKDEAQYWFTGKPNIIAGMNGIETREYVGDIENNFQKWFNQNVWNAEFKVLLANYDKIPNQVVSKEKFETLKDSIFSSKVNQNPDFKMDQILDDFFKTNVFSELWNVENSPMKQFETDFNEQSFINYFEKEFTYKLILPGEIINSNNAIVHGDTLIWKLTAYRMVPADYIIEAQSRKANIWAFILSGVIVLITIGSFIWKPRKM